ncbi:MAG: ATP synthase F1 subunit gamma [Bacteroidales bacterium]|nr:ATP synthase F1 subunit gamma [Bacteroidales bacterium]
MGSLKEIRGRIDSVTSTQQITSAMKMVSVSKLRKAQNAIIGLRPYSEKLTEMIGNLLNAGVATNDVWFRQQEQAPKILIVAIASNRGLCGAFNMNVAKKVELMLATDYKEAYENGNVKIITAGKQLGTSLKYKHIPVLENWDELSDNHVFEKFIEKVNHLLSDFRAEKFNRVVLVYNQFVNALRQNLMEEQFLPIVQLKTETKKSQKSEKNYAQLPVEFIYEPSKEMILQEVVPKMLRIQLYKAFLDSSAAEHGARMTAMHQASDNAAELLKELKMNYNKARQMAITNELLEIVSGSAGLE